MAILQVGSTTTATAENEDADGTMNLTIAKTVDDPVVAGDVLIAVITSNGDAQGKPSVEWTQFGGGTLAPTVAWQVRLYYKVCGASEPSNYTWTVGDTGPAAGHMTCWRGVNNGSPIAGINDTITNSTQSEPYTTPSLTPTGTLGRLFYVRGVRKTSAGGTGGTLTESDGDVMNHTPGVSGVSASGGTAYVVNLFQRLTQYTTGGSKAGLAITFSATEAQNYAAQFALQEDITGTVDSSLSPVVAAFTGQYATVDGSMAATLPKVVASFAGTAAPPSGTMDTVLSPVVAAFAGGQSHGTADATLPSVTSQFAGAVNPAGIATITLPSVTAQFAAETQPFGEHVIRVEADHRAFRVIQDDPGLIPIRRNQVTQE